MKMGLLKSRMLMRLSKLLVLSLVLGSIMAPPLFVKAEDSEDLLNKYGLTFGGPILSDVERRIVDNEYIIDSIRSKQSLDIQTDSLVTEYTKKQEQKLTSLQNDIRYYQNKNTSIAQDISNNLLTMSRTEIHNLDVEYKNNISKMNEKIDILNGYIFDYSIKDNTYDLSTYQQAIQEAREERKVAIDAFELGDISNIKWILPVTRDVAQGYGYHVDSVNTSVIKFFPGVYYKAQPNTEVKALFNGTVTATGYSKLNGNYIVITCDNTVKYMYTHLGSVEVTEGRTVKQYETVATTGSTGQSSITSGVSISLYLNGVAYNVDKLFQESK